MSRWPETPRVLFSYAYLRTAKGDPFAAVPEADIIIDSGAFTAHSSGVPIALSDYIAFLEDHHRRARFAFSLDVIGDPVASMRNWLKAQERLPDVPLVPTWHIGSDVKHLEAICAKTDYASIGGAVPHFRKRDALMRELIRAHRIARDHGTQLHGLGVTATDAVIKLPWASVDSSSWTIPGRMPMTYLARRDGRMFTTVHGDKIPPADAKVIRDYGGDPEAMSRYGFASTKTVGKELAKARKEWAVLAACRSYMHREGVKRTRDSSDFRLFFASVPRERQPFIAHQMGPIW